MHSATKDPVTNIIEERTRGCKTMFNAGVNLKESHLFAMTVGVLPEFRGVPLLSVIVTPN